MSHVLVFAALALCSVACGTTRYDYNYSQLPDPRRQEFILGPTDQIKIDVWRNEELSVETTIRPDGTITVPLVGDLRAAGRTPSQLRQELVQRLSVLFKSEAPQLTLAVTEVNSYKFTVIGSVERPGVVSSGNYVTVLEAVALAGGPNRFADAQRVTILRRDAASGQTQKIPINYETLKSGERMEQNVVILAGDTVHVP